MSVSGLSLYIQFSCVGVCVSIDLTKTIKTSYISQIIASLNSILFIKNIKNLKLFTINIYPSSPVFKYLHKACHTCDLLVAWILRQVWPKTFVDNVTV